MRCVEVRAGRPYEVFIGRGLMDAAGGPVQTVVRLFGGQGTINVNSWSPDSKKFAFVSYRIRGQA